MSRYKKDLGDLGEYAAENFLTEHGYTILCRKYYAKGGEIDLIAETDTHLVFVEVKTRSSETFGSPAEAVTKKKQLHMLTAAEAYLTDNFSEKEIRFDIIEVYAHIINQHPIIERINHIPDIVMEVEL